MMTKTKAKGIMYCPICESNLVATNFQEVEEGEHDGYIYVHDANTVHTDEDLEALENGVQ